MDMLILMRHAKAVREHEAPSDMARALTERGQEDAAEAGRALARAGLIPDRVIVSTALRTRETFLAAAVALNHPHVRLLDRLYAAEPGVIWGEAVRAGGARVLVVGHNPGLQALAAALVGHAHDRSAPARRLSEHLPTAAFAAFTLTGSTLEAPGPALVAAWAPAREEDL